MTSYNTYPILPSASPDATSQVAYQLNVVEANRRGLKAKEQMFKKKYEKYTKILNRLTLLNACSSGISIATEISSVATFVTLATNVLFIAYVINLPCTVAHFLELSNFQFYFMIWIVVF